MKNEKKNTTGEHIAKLPKISVFFKKQVDCQPTVCITLLYFINKYERCIGTIIQFFLVKQFSELLLHI